MSGTKNIEPKPEVGWPADQIERRATASLIPYARNARTHSAEQVAQIAASIEEWGWTMPVLTDERGELIAGHGRVMAAKQLGLESVPVMVARGWSEAMKRAYVLADNKLAMNATWDRTLLAEELNALAEAGFEMARMGFTPAELVALSSPLNASVTEPAEFSRHESEAFHSIVVHFIDPDSVAQFEEALGIRLADDARLIWYPGVPGGDGR